MNEEIEQKEVGVIYQGKYWHLAKDLIRTPDGREFHKEIVKHPGAVVIIPQLPNGKLLVVRQYRYGPQRFLLEFPAGTLEINEPPLLCAQREIQEEVGHQANNWHDLGTLVPIPGFCNEIQYMYFANDLSPSSLPKDDDEIMKTLEFSVAEIEAMILSNEFLDAKSIAIFTKARLAGLI